MSDPEYDIDPSTRFGRFAQGVIRGGTLEEEFALDEAEQSAPMPQPKTLWQRIKWLLGF